MASFTTPARPTAGNQVKAAEVDAIGQNTQFLKDTVDVINAGFPTQRSVKTANFTAVAGFKYAVDASAGAVTVTLPTTNTKADQIVIQKTDTSANLVTWSGTVDGVAATTGSARTQNQGKYFQGDGTGNWNIIAGDTSVAALDARYTRTINLQAIDYGLATTNTPAQNDTAIANAIAAAQAAGAANIIFPRGTFNVSAPINAKATNTYGDGIGFFGAGRKSTVFINQTDTSELLQVGGYNNYFKDFTIRHASFNPTATTGDGLVFYKCAYSTFERIQINETGRAVSIAQVGVNEPGTASGNAANWMFSCTFDSINVTRFSKNALFLNSYVGGSTGSHWRNLYLQNVSTGGVQVQSSGNAIDILNCDFTGDQINVEDGLNTASLLANGQSNVVITTMHLERINVAAGTNSIVRAYGGAQVWIGNLSYAFSNAGASGSGNTSLISAAYYGQMTVGSIELNNNPALTAGTYTIGEVTDTGNSATLEFGMVSSYQSPAYAALTNSTANPGLLRAGGKWWGQTTAAASGTSVGKACRAFMTGTDSPIPGFNATGAAVPLTGANNDDASIFGFTAGTTNATAGSATQGTVKPLIPGLYQVTANWDFISSSASADFDMLLIFGTANSNNLAHRAATTTATANKAGVGTTITRTVRVTAADVTAGKYFGMSTYTPGAGFTYRGATNTANWMDVVYLGS